MKIEDIDLSRIRCAWQAGSTQCAHLGTVTHSTLGGGPWYCWEHFSCKDGAKGAQIVQESLGQVRELVKPVYSMVDA